MDYRGLPGINTFLAYTKIYGHLIAPVDRSGLVKFPVRMKSLFPLPKMRKFEKTYERICSERARELLKRAEKLDTSIYVFWSGGVDSTCLLISLIKVASKEQAERIVVLMSEESIAEYPDFYCKHIRGKLRRKSAMLFPFILGTKNLIVTGEHNDQLFGADIILKVINRFGLDTVQGPYDRQLLSIFLAEGTGGDQEIARAYVKLFENLRERAPIALKTNYDIFWWINFVLKWQTVYMRILGFAAKSFSESYVKTYYHPFYNTEDFQLWSMNNLGQRMRNGWCSYKWPAKEVIYKFTKDADYRDKKIKRGSLQYLISERVPANFVDDKFVFHQDLTEDQFYEFDNVFA